jgi:hypothetical protein
VGGFELQRAREARQRGFKLRGGLFATEGSAHRVRARSARGARSAPGCYIRGFVIQALLFCQGVFVVRVWISYLKKICCKSAFCARCGVK